MYQLFFLHLLYSRHLLDIQNEQMKQMQANLVSTIKRSSSVNNEVIEYNRKLLQVCLLLLLLSTTVDFFHKTCLDLTGFLRISDSVDTDHSYSIT